MGFSFIIAIWGGNRKWVVIFFCSCYNAKKKGWVVMQKKLPLNALCLRVLALALMLTDHLWGTVVPGNDWMTFLGRLAFPIFAFQIAEGYFHTSNFRRYALRLLVFGLVSEIPFNLMLGSSLIYPFHQNVMFTLLLGLLGIRAVDRAKQGGSWWKALGILLLVTLGGAVGFTDYGYLGVLTVVAFGILRGFRGAKMAQLLAMLLLHGVLAEGWMLPVGPLELPVQSFAVLALIPIWLYNGEQGPRNRMLQYGSYVFYPAHMVVLYLIRAFG